MQGATASRRVVPVSHQVQILGRLCWLESSAGGYVVKDGDGRTLAERHARLAAVAAAHQVLHAEGVL